MPKHHVKQKVLGGRAEVLAYERDPSTFYFRQYNKPTRSYRSSVMEGVVSLEDAIEKAPDYLLAFTQHPQGRVPLINNPLVSAQPYRQGASVIPASTRQRRETIDKALGNFLKQEESRVRGGLIKDSSLKRWEKVVRLGIGPYLKDKRITDTSQITENTFDDYAAFRSDAVRTRISLRGELDVINQFIRTYLVKHRLIAPELAVSREMVKRPKLRESDLLANPGLR